MYRCQLHKMDGKVFHLIFDNTRPIANWITTSSTRSFSVPLLIWYNTHTHTWINELNHLKYNTHCVWIVALQFSKSVCCIFFFFSLLCMFHEPNSVYFKQLFDNCTLDCVLLFKFILNASLWSIRQESNFHYCAFSMFLYSIFSLHMHTIEHSSSVDSCRIQWTKSRMHQFSLVSTGSMCPFMF